MYAMSGSGAMTEAKKHACAGILFEHGGGGRSG
jgi:hypothetical protein